MVPLAETVESLTTLTWSNRPLSGCIQRAPGLVPFVTVALVDVEVARDMLGMSQVTGERLKVESLLELM